MDSGGKVQVPRPPPIWAQSRQEVCESLKYFRSYHSGVYFNGTIAKGYLLSAFAASRDLFHHGGKLIISHGGGRCEKPLDSPAGHHLRSAQRQTPSVRALLRNYVEKRPLVLLADDNYVLFPYDLGASGYTYVVLGIFWISHAWAEYVPDPTDASLVVRWKFSFQWCEDQGSPWWLSNEEDIASFLDLSFGEPHPHFCCTRCSQESPVVYDGSEMCLNPGCTDFWKTNGKEPEVLNYAEKFLRLQPRTFDSLPTLIPTRGTQPTTSHPHSRGWHCISCGRLSCRTKWECLECSHCQVSVRIRIVVHKELNGLRLTNLSIGRQRKPVSFTTSVIHMWLSKWEVRPLVCRGKVHLIPGTSMANEDANRIFESYQRQATSGELELRRYPLRKVELSRGTLLCNYFSQNSGEPYNYVGGATRSVPLANAPNCVREALDLITERAQMVVSQEVQFNEVLTAAYLESQKMSFHSDDEKGLGSVVATLSLGSPATMRFRPRANAAEKKKRKETHLTLVLRHGDVVVMEGSKIQVHYEHSVIPTHFRIAATARWINPA
ncbi:hypothetical protein EDD16DRAFT_1502659 [Pisolithus croceorrhizus]|nr:hypothetical protein EDD16DRAFT_1502659 [Pisolithus croceorrhizus]KAI6117759.1 hypothetical protein EV401DRAFT_1863162 [Pisolithus croceorrhizus]KAI6159742.1 hypothetical protein EDD17DRAFT_1486203 [Pisolithus thermaeus]